jgi:soluble lytic murein transglycosylase-like protein
LKLKITLLSTFILSFISFSASQNAYADYLPQAYIDSVLQRTAKPVAKAEPDFNSFIHSHNPKLQIQTVKKIAQNVKKYSDENNVDPKLVLALMARESSFRSNVVSKSGAIGLGQLKMATARDMGVGNPFNIIENIKGTVKYLSWLLKHNDGDVDMTLASYNMGPGAVKRAVNSGITLPEKVERYVSDIKNFHSMM